MSQASTGILLTAAGLMILLITLQSIVRESQVASETDPLSGLANRRGFDLRAGQALERAKGSKLPVSVATFDIDHFKSINDSYGHTTGDEVIKNFADLLRRAAPHAAVIGRVGGEEFALLFEHTNQEGARLNAEAIRIAAAVPGLPGSPAFTVSGGVTSVRQGETLSEAAARGHGSLCRQGSRARPHLRSRSKRQPARYATSGFLAYCLIAYDCKLSVFACFNQPDIDTD